MQQQTQISPISYGFIGCSSGYQVSTMGIDKELGIAYQYLDLPSDVSSSLPNPNDRDLSPLFCLAQFEEKGYQVLTFTEYHSIKQIGTDRPGTFLGAFIESVNSQFSENAGDTLLETLKNLCSEQYKKFVDPQQNRYKDNINNQPLPKIDLSLLSNHLTKRNFAIPREQKSLYIHCPSDKFFEKVFRLIMAENLLTYFSKIYFSASQTIKNGFKDSQFEILEPSFSSSDEYLRSLLKSRINQSLLEKQKILQEKQYSDQELQQLKTTQDKLIENAVKERAEKYIQEAEQARQSVAEMQKSLESSEVLSSIGKEVIHSLSQRYQRLADVDLSKFGFPREETNDKFMNIESRIANVLNEINRLRNEISIPKEEIHHQKKSNGWIILSGALGFLSICLIGFSIYLSLTTVSNEKYSLVEQRENKISQELQDKSDENSRLEKENRELKRQIELNTQSLKENKPFGKK